MVRTQQGNEGLDRTLGISEEAWIEPYCTVMGMARIQSGGREREGITKRYWKRGEDKKR